MFVDSTGSLGSEHARDLRRAGKAYRLSRAAATHSHLMRAFAARAQLGPIVNYRAY